MSISGDSTSKHHDLTISQNTHLDRQQLSYCVSLIENGANPEALAVCSNPIHPEGSSVCSVSRAVQHQGRLPSEYTNVAQKVILQLREEYPASSIDGDAEDAGAR